MARTVAFFPCLRLQVLLEAVLQESLAGPALLRFACRRAPSLGCKAGQGGRQGGIRLTASGASGTAFAVPRAELSAEASHLEQSRRAAPWTQRKRRALGTAEAPRPGHSGSAAPWTKRKRRFRAPGLAGGEAALRRMRAVGSGSSWTASGDSRRSGRCRW